MVPNVVVNVVSLGHGNSNNFLPLCESGNCCSYSSLVIILYLALRSFAIVCNDWNLAKGVGWAL